MPSSYSGTPAELTLVSQGVQESILRHEGEVVLLR